MLDLYILRGAKLLSISGTFLSKRTFLVAIKVSLRSLVPFFSFLPLLNSNKTAVFLCIKIRCGVS
jgi:hypothetical protein